MKIGIIGAGFTGLAAGYMLSNRGYEVVIYEKDAYPGGLALGYQEKEWKWSLETHYHHWFINDDSVLNLAKEIGHEVIIRRPKTSSYIDGAIYRLDSPVTLLTFPKLSIWQRLRMAAILGMLRYNPFWKPFEKVAAHNVLPNYMGKRGYRMVWEPLLKNKFGDYADDISLAWFWARIKKRTSNLAYPKGGFLEFANVLVKNIEQKGGKVLFNTEVKEVKSDKTVQVGYSRSSGIEHFDKVIVTLPSFFFVKIAPQLPNNYKNKLMELKGLGAVNLVLRLRKQFLRDNTYWLSICDTSSPIMAIVEHTNFMDKKYYNNEHIVYVGKYLPYDHPYMKMTKHELLKTYTPYLKKINANFELLILNFELIPAPSPA